MQLSMARIFICSGSSLEWQVSDGRIRSAAHSKYHRLEISTLYSGKWRLADCIGKGYNVIMPRFYRRLASRNRLRTTAGVAL